MLGLGLAALGAAPARLEGQYFGRNKVLYRTFDFRVLKTPHFDIYYYPEEEVATRDAARMAERWYARYTRILDHEFQQRQPVILYASHPHFQQTAALGGDIDEGTGGVTEAFKQRVILPLAGSYEETNHVLGHELVHAFQYDITGVGRAGGGLEAASQRTATPLWFTEGMAEYLSVGPVDAHTAMWLRDAALTGNVPSIDELTRNPSYFPYRWGQALWAYIGGRWGDAAIGQILKQVGQGVPYPEAFQRILNTPLDEISADWQSSIRRTYLPLLTERREAREQATALITNKKRGGRVNLAPSLSPDGKTLAFLSELDFLDIQLYLADAATGQVTRRLVKGTAFDPHFGSLRYISSSGTWSPDGRQFAFSALREARDEVVILDVASARVLHEYPIPGVGEINNPTWSPDGSTIVVSGLKGGMTDLYAVDVASGTSRALTNDRYADMQPSFSPDGRTLAFVTDRGTGTDLDSLRFGGYRVALMDYATGAIRAVPAMAGHNNIDPQWTADGRSLFFVSNRTGIPNIYRVDVTSGELRQVTNLFTGVSGITPLSPAITASRSGDRVVFTAYERNFGFNIYSLDTPQRLAGTVVPASQAQVADAVPLPAVLPPAPRPTEPAFNRVGAALANATYGLPSSSEALAYQTVPYRPRLGLDYLGQPQVGVSTGGGIYGRGGLYGGISGIFSDMLGRHTIYGTLQAQGQLDEIGFSAVYLNQQRRWNYGVAAERVPYIAGAATASGFDPASSELRDQLLLFRYFDTRLGGIAQYPFSNVQRVEFSGGFRRISQDIQIQEYFCPAEQQADGSIACVGSEDFRTRKQHLPSFNLVEGSGALIYDSSLEGYTSPFAGQRYHFEIAPTFGTGRFVEATADYRKYFFLRPMTLAFRGLHFGRYGRDQRLFGDQFLGYSFFIRGYDYNSVRDQCNNEVQTGSNNGRECVVLDQLFGSRIGVGNAELRVPILSRLVGGSGLSPIEGIAFADAGVAWGQTTNASSGALVNTSPVFRRGLQDDLTKRGILTSAGVGGRINVFGYVIVEADFVKAFERDKGWHWQFAFQPGF
jgi:Tol biopolymer transport system component